MKCLHLILCFLFISKAALAQPKKSFRIELLGGFGKQRVVSAPKALSDGTPINFELDFLKSFRACAITRISKKYEIGLDIGFTYDYQIDYTAQIGHSGGGLSAALAEAGSEYYTVWHVILNCYRQLWAAKRWELKGYGGIGIQVFPYDNYYKVEEVADPIPGSRTKYTYQPSIVNKHPIVVLNAGMELHYKFKKYGALFIRPTVQLGTKPFITDIVRIEAPNASQEIQSTMSGTHAILSLGYSYTFK